MRFLFFILILVFTLPFNGFSQSKKKKDGQPSLLSRTYHNTTARYNGYFNAKMKMKESVAQMETDKEIDYDQILEFYSFLGESTGENLAPDMDIIIEKTNMVIDKHGKSKWVDDCYLLMAKAYLLKKDYDNAYQTILYITSEYHHNKKLEAKRKKKKKKKKKKKYKYKYKKKGQSDKPFIEATLEKHKITHQPNYYEAIILLVQILIEQDNLYKAQTVYDFAKNDKDMPEYVKDDMKLVEAYLAIQKEDYGAAIQPLKEVIKLTPRKKKQSKYMYILAQLYRLEGDNKKAIESYNKVLKLNPEYELAFNAKLSIAKTFEKRAGISMREVKAILIELLKDEKNIDFQDEIYYMMGNLSLKQGRTEDAFNHFKKSIAVSTVNAQQKGLSYQAIGDIRLEEKNYQAAYIYYDSALTYLSKDKPEVAAVQEEADRLKKLYLANQVIHVEDSLQQLAALPEVELDEFIDNLIEEKLDELERKKEEEEFKKQQQLENSKSGGFNLTYNSQKVATFYFYDETIRLKGVQDFLAKWGNRKLEDHWRRSEKSSGGSVAEDEEENEYEIAENNISDREQYYAMIPLTTEKMEASHAKIQDAYIDAAVVYKDDLKNNNEAIDMLNTLLEKYPDGKNDLMARFYLYLLYNQEGLTEKAKVHKEYILRKYPDSDIAKHLREGKNDKKKVNADYQMAFNHYQNKEYADVILACNQASKNNDLSNKQQFLLLKAMTLGRQQKFQDMVGELEQVIAIDPKSPEGTRAEGILNALSQTKKEKESKAEQNSIYVYRPKQNHYFCIAITNEEANKQNLSVVISQFNQTNHRLEDYQISTITLGKTHSLVVVKSFVSVEKALKYHETIKNDKTLFNKIPPSTIEHFLISENNFKKFLALAEVDQYMEFHNKYYN